MLSSSLFAWIQLLAASHASYESERKRKLADVEYPPASSSDRVEEDPAYWMMTMKVCQARLAEIAARTWQDPRVWYRENEYSAPEACYRSNANVEDYPRTAFRSLPTVGSTGAFDLDLLQMSLGGGVLSTGVTYHETRPSTVKDYRTYDGHYRYEQHERSMGLGLNGPIEPPTEEQYRLWKARDTALQNEKARIKAMHASALHSILHKDVP